MDNNICKASGICKYKNIKNNYKKIKNLKIYQLKIRLIYLMDFMKCR